VNEVEPWSARARRALDRARRTAGVAWTWFTDLGQGAWLLALGVAIVAAIGLAVIVGRGGPVRSACAQADSLVAQVQTADGKQLSGTQVARLHLDATQLDALAKTAYGDDPGALRYAAQMAHAARVGQPFDAGISESKFKVACGSYS
jgi:hypothetical protein